ncbi:RNA-directed DNA polymerase, eukaryota, reverse transcriptase zinc-binding domain protein [Tanacetum coccineum]
MIRRIMTCVTSTKFSININGERVGYFKGGRGLRQGDLISPYLFTLVMGVLNLLIRKNIEEVSCGAKMILLKGKLCYHGMQFAKQQIKGAWSKEFSEFIETRDVYDARLNNNCTVSEIIQEGRWMWPEEWNNDFERLRQVQVPVLNDENEDTALWVSSLGQEQQFKIRNIWKDMNYNNTKVDWFSRFAQSIPRHAFVTWLAVQKRLMTHDKLMIWRPNDDLKCALCNKCPNSHNHLCFLPIISEIKAPPSNKNI